MDEEQFWSLIEESWESAGGFEKQRRKLAGGTLRHEKAELLVEILDEVLRVLRSKLNDLAADDLLAFDRILERKLYDIDRAEVQEATDGSDDGFLYARGFIVAAGKAYYDAVNEEPSRALMDLECEEMCYLSYHLYEEKVGKVPPSDISRESCSNPQGWEQ
jgi:hypothetical protein